MDNQLIIDGPKNKKLLITFDFPSDDIESQSVNEDIFYAEEIEVQENIHQEIVVETTTTGSSSLIDYENVHNKFKNDVDVNSYQEVIQSLIPLSENIELKQEYDFPSETEVNEDDKILLDSSPTKSFFGSSMGVSRCPVCHKFTKRSSYENHMMEHYSDVTTSSSSTVTTSSSSSTVKTSSSSTDALATENDLQLPMNNGYDIHVPPDIKDIRFRCSICNFCTSSSNDLDIHIESAHNSALQCGICSFSSADTVVLMSHMENHEATFECSMCDYITNEEIELNQHSLEHVNERVLKCDLCEFTTHQTLLLKNHTRSHFGEKPFVCPFCEFRSVERSSLTQHVRIHNVDKLQHCNICNFKCIQKSALKVHVRTHSSSLGRKKGPKSEPVVGGIISQFQCPDCDFITKRKNSFFRHQMMHSIDKPFKCNQCKYQSSQKAAYISHLQRHRGEKPYKCTECNYSSVEKTHLVRHMRQHTGEKPIFCFVCDYRCIQFGCLVSHMKRHNGSYIQCAFCNFNTSSSETIVNHVRLEHKRCWHKTSIHLCSICGYKCTDSSSLTIHMGNEHSLDPPPGPPAPSVAHNEDTKNLFKCAECDFETSNKRYMKAHRKKEHQ